MNSQILKYLAAATLSIFLVGCGEKQSTLTVGSKLFTESEILAEMIAQVAEQEGIPVDRKHRFGTTNTVLEGLKQGVLDVYPEYNGTSLTFLGQAPSSDSENTTETVNRLFEPLGLELAGRFGFSNDYVMTMTRERAEELGVTRISDLTALADPVVFAIDSDFLERPADGLQQMKRRYGINNAEHTVFPQTSEGKEQQVTALLDREADVAELYATDGQIAEYDLVVLEDDEAFFPVYDAMPLVRSEALEQIPGLADVLGKLEGVITPADMQQLNKAVDLEAQTPAAVATTFLASKGLLPEGSGSGEADELFVAIDPGVERDSSVSRAIRSIRAGFEGNSLSLKQTESPLQALSNGEARVALVGAEAFYAIGDNGPEATGNAEAIAVLGYRTGHLFAMRDGPDSITEMSRISSGAVGTSSANVLGMVLHSLGSTAGAEVVNSDASLLEQVAQLVAGEVDGVFVMATQGDREVMEALEDRSVALIGLDEWAEGGHTARFSFLRPATIPASTYASQFQRIPSISTQYVLAGPVERVQAAGEVGPGTAGTGEDGIIPITGDAVSAIREALSATDLIDPAIPKHSSLVPSIEVADKSLPFSIDVSIANILIVLFMIWVVYLCLLPTPRRFTLPDDKD